MSRRDISCSAAGDADRAGSPQPRGGGADFPHRTAVLGEPAQVPARGDAADLACERPPTGVSTNRERIPGGSGGRERGTRAHHPSIALFGGGPLAAWSGGGAGIAEVGGAAG